MELETIHREDGGADFHNPDCPLHRNCYSINKEGMGIDGRCPHIKVPEMECELDDC